MSSGNYHNFFEEIEKFKEKQDKQKQRGLNDYNLLTTLLEPHDEVKLHSRMIGSLINPKGLHYQNRLFIDKFFDELNLDDFEMDMDNICVYIEYKNIDLYITDGKKHIIIENKIWAGDQPCQLMKYINIIVEENKKDFGTLEENSFINKDLLRVIYLTPQNKNTPDNHIVENNYITFNPENIKTLSNCSKNMNINRVIEFELKNYQVRFHKMDYTNILSWLQKCQYEVQNITNLNESIRQYMDVVQIINGTYKGKVMKLEDILLESQEKFILSKEIYIAHEKAIKKNKIDFFEKIKDKLNDIEIEIFSKEEIRLVIKKSTLHDIKLQVTCDKDDTLSATLFIEKDGEWIDKKKWIDRYKDENETKISEFIGRTDNIKHTFKHWCYFEINPNPDINLKEKLFTNNDVSNTTKILLSLYSDLINLDLK